MNIIRVQLFAGPKEIVGLDYVDIITNSPTFVSEIRSTLESRFPELRAHLQYGRFAMNHRFLNDDEQIDLSPSTEPISIAFIPPVSGG